MPIVAMELSTADTAEGGSQLPACHTAVLLPDGTMLARGCHKCENPASELYKLTCFAVFVVWEGVECYLL